MDDLMLGSLFDGSGGFPLGGLIAGITPVWASEIEPFPIRVTTKRVPSMKHYGDVSRVDGSKVEPVDIITFGSPCQDMSVAGRRSGLDGTRSSLFYEAVRIIKEMRGVTNGKYPRYAVWENVPGAFSSNGGEDFRAVLETLCSVKFENVSVPRPERWPSAGEIVADGFSLAWRVLDAQYWGVPQRRKRIFLVADFTGGSAGKILFESEGLSGYSAESFRAWQRTAGSAADGIGSTGICLNDQGGQQMNVTVGMTGTLRAEAHHPPCVMESAGFLTEPSAKSRSIGYGEEVSPTIRTEAVPAVMMLENHPADSRITVSENDKVQTLTSRMGTGGGNVPLVMGVQKTYGIGAYNSEGMKSDNPNAGIYEADTSRTLDCSGGTPSVNQGGIAVVESYHEVYALTTGPFLHTAENLAPTLAARDYKDPTVVQSGYTVRRLTPTECARLQGFPDWWCENLGTEEPTDEEMSFWHKVFEDYRRVMNPNAKPKTSKQILKWLKNPHSDSAEYKMWGNGVALPCVVFVLSGIAYYSRRLPYKI